MTIKTYAQWCWATHGHSMMEHPNGTWMPRKEVEAELDKMREALKSVDEAMKILRPQCTEGADVADILDSFIPQVREALGEEAGVPEAQYERECQLVAAAVAAWKQEAHRRLSDLLHDPDRIWCDACGVPNYHDALDALDAIPADRAPLDRMLAEARGEATQTALRLRDERDAFIYPPGTK